MVLNKSAVMKLFKKKGLQVNLLALNHIDEWMYEMVDDMILNAKNANVKRIAPNDVPNIIPTVIHNLAYSSGCSCSKRGKG